MSIVTSLRPATPSATGQLNFDQALREILPRLADGSLKVGIQGNDANRWRIDEVCHALDGYRVYAEVVAEELGVQVPTIDIWGGGQVSQVVRFLGEDPFENLERLRAVAPELRFKCIYRGRQGFGFLPCSTEVQRLAITESARLGVHDFRMFDPLNDFRNLEAGLSAVLDFRRQQANARVTSTALVRAEALVFYVSPPKGSTAVWTPNMLARNALELANMGFHSISIADYAHQLREPSAAVELVRKLRSVLNDNGYDHVELNLFAQGATPTLINAVLRTGLNSVDVAVGSLAGVLSNPDMMDVLRVWLAAEGFDLNQKLAQGHPVLEALERYKQRIAEAGARHRHYRMPDARMDTDQISESRLAFNAISAYYSLLDKNWHSNLKRQLPEGFVDRHGDRSKDEYVSGVLKTSEALWIAGGQFQLVSPFGFVLSLQSDAIFRRTLRGEPIIWSDYRREYRDVLKGRYGRNHGVELGLCDQRLILAFHVLEALEVLLGDTAGLSRPALHALLAEAGLSVVIAKDEPETGCKVRSLMQLERMSPAQSPWLELDMAQCRRVLLGAPLAKELAAQVAFAFSSERFPEPREGLAEGRRLVQDWEARHGLWLSRATTDDRLSPADRAAMMAILFKVNEAEPYAVTMNLYRHLQSSTKASFGDIEPDIRPFDHIFQEELDSLAKILAKQDILTVHRSDPCLSGRRKKSIEEGLSSLEVRRDTLEQGLAAHLTDLGYRRRGHVASNSLEFAYSAIEKVVNHGRARWRESLAEISPHLWSY
jgi:pyruvate/oxaloacetate carboxyltransferase